VPDLLLVERPEGVLYWHPTGEYLFARRPLAEIVPAEIAHAGQQDEVCLSPVLEDPRPWEHLTDDDLLALASSQAASFGPDSRGDQNRYEDEDLLALASSQAGSKVPAARG
jgi:hypothetical protein